MGVFLCLHLSGFLSNYRQSVRGSFKPAAFDLHFGDGELVAFQLFAARRLIRFGIV
jgi:hypothetical protein